MNTADNITTGILHAAVIVLGGVAAFAILSFTFMVLWPAALLVAAGLAATGWWVLKDGLDLHRAVKASLVLVGVWLVLIVLAMVAMFSFGGSG